jgi:hypothetical protein
MAGRLQYEASEGMAAMKISFKNPRAYRNDFFGHNHVFSLTLIASAARVVPGGHETGRFNVASYTRITHSLQ